MDRVTVDLVDDLARGAGLLATGGPLYAADVAAPLRAALTEHGPVPVVAADALDPAASVLALDVLGVGLPTVDAVRRVASAAASAGWPCAAVVPLGTGGLGGLVAPYAAAVLGLPCVDADGGRRGPGRLDRTLFALGGLAASPAWVSDGHGGTVTVDAADNAAAHRMLHATASGLGGPALVGAYPMTAADCARTAATGALSRCAVLGAALPSLRTSPGLLAAHAVRLLLTGRVAHVARNATPAAVRGTATVESTTPPVRTLRVDFQLSNLVASEDGVVYATVPDLITIVDADTWTPTQAELVQPGQLVHVLAIPAHERWRAVPGLAAAGPRQFGYDIDYEPLVIPSPLLPIAGPVHK